MNAAVIVAIAIATLIGGLVAGFIYGVYRRDIVAQKEAGKDGNVVIDRDDGEFNLFCEFAQSPRETFRNGQVLNLKVRDISSTSQEKQPS